MSWLLSDLPPGGLHFGWILVSEVKEVDSDHTLQAESWNVPGTNLVGLKTTGETRTLTVSLLPDLLETTSF